MIRNYYYFQSKVCEPILSGENPFVLLSSGIPEILFKEKETIQVILDGFKYEGTIRKMLFTEKDKTDCYGLELSNTIQKKINKGIGQLVDVIFLSGKKKIYRVL
ncbi:hypothetical protein [Enterococcus sp. AZ007]|uniref:hypothetical protein n=1 Tax=Enterococcus sp. AZ007 TaxID=2774839 RepID=UPI003F298147